MAPDGDGNLDPVPGSAATDDDGKFSLQSLIPGNYKVRFSADGLPSVWYRTGSRRRSRRRDPTRPATGARRHRHRTDRQRSAPLGRSRSHATLPTELQAIGDPGRRAHATHPTAARGPTAATQGGDEPAAAPFRSPSHHHRRDYRPRGLPTPATYTVTVTGPGFETQQFEQTTHRWREQRDQHRDLTAATGTIEGVVRDPTSRPLGGVAVTARSGDIEIKSITPTTGNVGQFRIVGLPKRHRRTRSRSNSPATAAHHRAQPRRRREPHRTDATLARRQRHRHRRRRRPRRQRGRRDLRRRPRRRLPFRDDDAHHRPARAAPPAVHRRPTPRPRRRTRSASAATRYRPRHSAATSWPPAHSRSAT